jgi:two-component system chemotaxis sensor kinase CheA
MSEPEIEFNAQFFEQFLDDYLAEADEHLRSLRRNILDLEDSLSTGHALKKTTLDELFRSFHTLKGISAMAGVSAAEAMAHTMESYLRPLRDGQSQFSEQGLSALSRGTKKLEEIVAAKRTGAPPPSIVEETELLESVTAEESSTSALPEVSTEAAPATAGGSLQYLFTFTSAKELAARDINVNSVRERLQRIGTITKSSPKVRDGGQVVFEFAVETSQDPVEFDGWSEDGIDYELIQPASGATITNPVDAENEIASAVLAGSNVVRVDLSRLDDLMRMLGELVISRAKLAEHLKKIGDDLGSELRSSLDETNHTIELQLRNLRDAIMRTRMSPIGEVFERLEFAVRDLARESGKKVRLQITGESTEVDKMLVETVLDPLLHLVRNAVSHGIENPDVRTAKGKPDYGTIRLDAKTIGETVLLEVSDDGVGVDRERVHARARERGVLNRRDVNDDAALLDVLCTAGFSTRDRADKASGRGVGMDVVRRAIDELNGTITIGTAPGKGTSFKIQFPLTLAIADALIVSVDGQRFAVPQAGVMEVIEVEQTSVSRFENNEIIDHRGTSMPLIRLSKLFALEDGYKDVFHAFVVGEGKQAVGIAVDRVIGQAEIVIRALSDSLTHVPGISGATELGDGRIVLILDVPTVTRRLRHAL